MLAAVVWHYWIAVALAIPAVGMAFVVLVLYLRNVVMPRYPQREQPRERPVE